MPLPVHPADADVDAAGPTDPTLRASKSRLRYLPVAAIGVVLVLAYAFGLHDYVTLAELADRRDELRALVNDYSPYGALLFGVLYALTATFALPISGVLTVFAGFLFGWFLAGIVVSISATIGATAVFLAARSAFGDILRDRIKGRLAALTEGFEKSAFGYLLVLRMTPIFPFFVVNVAPAFFRVSASTYVATTFLGILPGTFTLAYLGEGIDSVLSAAQAAGRDPTLSDIVTPQITLAFVALALITVLAVVVKHLWMRRTKGVSPAK